MPEDYGVVFLTDANGTTIDTGTDYQSGYDLMIPQLVPGQDVAEGQCDYIAAAPKNIIPDTNGKGKAPIKGSAFKVDHKAFIERISSWYTLKRLGREWYAENKATSAAWVKGRIQAALLPFGIPEKEMTSLYRELQTYCQSFESTVQPLEIVTAEDLKKEFKRPPFIVQDIMTAGLVLLAAPPKTGKSYLAIDLACCIAEGKPFWGLRTEQGSVLYCDMEGAEWRTQIRLPAVGRSSGTDCPKALSIVYRNVAPVDAGLIEQLTSWIDSAENPRLIILDTLAHVKGRVSRGEDAYTADTRFMKPLHDLAIAKGIAILAITHTRKANGFVLDDPFDAILGSTAQYSNSDTGWIIGGKRAENTKQFSAVGRDFEPVAFEIERSASGRWICNGRMEDVQERTEYDTYQRDPFVTFLKVYLPKCGGRWIATANDVMNEIAKETGHFLETDATKMSKRIREIMPKLLEYDGIVTIAPEGGGRKGRRFTFEQRTMTN